MGLGLGFGIKDLAKKGLLGFMMEFVLRTKLGFVNKPLDSRIRIKISFRR
jgi:hypothetical protein